jgi:hypothetical protein
MKTFSIYFGVLSALMLLSNCSGNAQSPETRAASGADRIEVLDFHTAHRCHTCLEIERLTRETLTSAYGAHMETGTITFRTINVDEKANDAIVKKYLAFGTSLFLNVVQNGREKHIDLTNFAFMNAGNEKKFTDGLKDYLNAELKNIQ